MVVGMSSGQNIMPIPKRQEPQRTSSTKNSFDDLMKDKINQSEEMDKPKAPADKKPVDKADDKATSDKQEQPKVDDKKADEPTKGEALTTEQAMAAMLASLNASVNTLSVTDVVAQAVQQTANVQDVQVTQANQSAQQIVNVQQGEGAELSQEFILPKQGQKAPAASEILSDALQGKDTQQAVQSPKIPFEEVVDAGTSNTKGATVDTAQNSSGTQGDMQGGKEAQAPVTELSTAVNPQDKKPVTDGLEVNITAQQPTVKTLDPDNVNIKVGEAVDTKSETFVQEFTDKIVVKINQDIKEFDIQLDPQNMGKVSIKITFAAEKAFISMNCDNAKTQSLLAQSSDTIRSIIQQHVGSETVVVVQENQQQNHQHQQQQQQNEEQEQQQHRANHTPSDDTQTFINQLRLGLVNMTSEG